MSLRNIRQRDRTRLNSWSKRRKSGFWSWRKKVTLRPVAYKKRKRKSLNCKKNSRPSNYKMLKSKNNWKVWSNPSSKSKIARNAKIFCTLSSASTANSTRNDINYSLLSAKSPYIQLEWIFSHWICDCDWLQERIVVELTLEKGFSLPWANLGYRKIWLLTENFGADFLWHSIYS